MTEKITPIAFGERPERVTAHSRLNSYLIGTLPVLDAAGWETEGVYLGLAGGEDRVVAYYWGGDDGGDAFRITLLVNRTGASYLIERPGDEGGVEGNLALGVPAPTPQEAREMYFKGTA